MLILDEVSALIIDDVSAIAPDDIEEEVSVLTEVAVESLVDVVSVPPQAAKVLIANTKNNFFMLLFLVFYKLYVYTKNH